MPTELESAIDDLKSYRKLHIETAKRLTKSYAAKPDRLILGIISRSMSLSAGFISLVTAQNYISAIPMVRMQLDNILRLHALYIANDEFEFINKILDGDGEHIGRLKDKNGKNMVDSYLLKDFISHNPNLSWFKTVYEKTSGYVHLSNIHTKAIIHSQDEKGFTLLISETVFVPEKDYLEAVQAFIHLTQILFEIIIRDYIIPREEANK